MTGSVSRKTLISMARFFALQHRYFWGRGGRTCTLCGAAPATFAHLLCECAGSAEIRADLDIPTAKAYLRVFLLTRTAKQLHQLVTAMEKLLVGYKEGAEWDEEWDAGAEGHRQHGGQPPRGVATPFDRGKCWEVRWDGSFGQSTGAGLGVTIAREGEVILRASIPVYATDATRCEALGPAIASLLLQRLPV